MSTGETYENCREITSNAGVLMVVATPSTDTFTYSLSWVSSSRAHRIWSASVTAYHGGGDPVSHVALQNIMTGRPCLMVQVESRASTPASTLSSLPKLRHSGMGSPTWRWYS